MTVANLIKKYALTTEKPLDRPKVELSKQYLLTPSKQTELHPKPPEGIHDGSNQYPSAPTHVTTGGGYQPALPTYSAQSGQPPPKLPAQPGMSGSSGVFTTQSRNRMAVAQDVL